MLYLSLFSLTQLSVYYVGPREEKDEQGGEIGISESREGGQREVPGSSCYKAEEGMLIGSH